MQIDAKTIKGTQMRMATLKANGMPSKRLTGLSRGNLRHGEIHDWLSANWEGHGGREDQRQLWSRRPI